MTRKTRPASRPTARIVGMSQDEPRADTADCHSGLPAVEGAVFKFIVENAIDVIVRVDATLNRIYVSPSSRDMLGFEPAEMLGNHGYALVHPDDLDLARRVLGGIGPQDPNRKLTFRMRRKDGTYVWVSAVYRYLPADGGVLGVLRDITAQKLTEQRLAEANARLENANAALREIAQVDGLTGLSNRRHFDELLDEELRKARRYETALGLVLLDVDHFKAFNDRYGHVSGDDCLKRVSRCVIGSLRRPGDHAARYGGEEIAMLLPSTDADGAGKVAEGVRAAVANLRIEHGGSTVGQVAVSAGAAAYSYVTNIDPTGLIEAADIALYQAKSAGRNCVRVFSNGLAHADVA